MASDVLGSRRWRVRIRGEYDFAIAAYQTGRSSPASETEAPDKTSPFRRTVWKSNERRTARV